VNAQPSEPRLQLQPWSVNDFPLLHLLNAPDMTEHVGGPESEEKLQKRQEKYVAGGPAGSGGMFTVVLMPERQATGSIGYWQREWQGETVYETGWAILPAYQGRGIAAEATGLVIGLAAAERRHRHLHAYPSIDNPASNAICRKVGFVLLGESDFEYPPGHQMRCNDWRFDLSALQ
jgi:RimJ/RimL family protein N-acetyltransferase